jgi:hypothetical protein
MEMEMAVERSGDPDVDLDRVGRDRRLLLLFAGRSLTREIVASAF